MKPKRKAGALSPAAARLGWRCRCGALLEAHVEHYDKIRCPSCGAVYWALWPARSSFLKMVLHPGREQGGVSFTR